MKCVVLWLCLKDPVHRFLVRSQKLDFSVVIFENILFCPSPTLIFELWKKFMVIKFGERKGRREGKKEEQRKGKRTVRE